MVRQKPQRPEKATTRREAAPQTQGKRHPFHLEFLNQAQKMAWGAFDQHDVLFLLGPPGTGKSHLATAFAISEILAKRKKKIILTRPIVEAGESLGFLPGSFDEKVAPYMMPILDCIDRSVGAEGPQREIINRSIEVAPIAYMRGRSQPLDSGILTPNGYVSMGEVKKGDFVIGSQGFPIRVDEIYPQGELDVYKVSFTDGTSVECSADHLWDTTTLYERRYKKGFSTKTTAEISKSIKRGHAYNHQIPIAQPVKFSRKELPIDPYVLGLLLGDGSLHESASVKFTSVDVEMAEELQKRLPESLKVVLCKDDFKLRSPQYRIVKTNQDINEMKSELKNLDLLGKLSYNKFIPEIYKQGDVSQRIDLLRGLLDTDGCCFEQKGKRQPRVQYYSTSENLARDVASLVYSLGGTASVIKRTTNKKVRELNGREFSSNYDMWVVSIRILENPFKLKRKSDKFVPLIPLRSIVSIEKVGRKQCQCIRVDSKDNLYLTEHCIVTHNTFNDSICIFDEAQNATKSQLKLFMTRFGENSKIIITGDPNQSDLRPCDQGLMHIVSKLEDLSGVGVIYFKASSIVRHPMIAAILERLEEKAPDQ